MIFPALIKFPARAWRIGRPALGLVAGLLAGCVHYQPRPIDAEATARAWSTRSLDDAGLRHFFAQAVPAEPAPWPLATWNLDQLTVAAIYEQPNLAVARAQWEVARAATVTAGERPNPSISASATYDTTTPPPWIPALSFDVPIETAGKRGDRLAQAEAQAESARWDLVDKIWQARGNVRSALLDLYRARQTAHLLAEQERAQSAQVRLLEGQLRVGAVALAEVTPARIALDTTRLSEAQARTDAIKALAALADAVGVPAAALRDVKFSFAGLDAFPTALTAPEVRRAAVLNRADVRGALANYAASQAALQLAIAQQYPDIHLGPGYELDQTDNKWTLGLTLELPLFNQHRGPIAEATARRQLAAAQFLATQAKALNETETAFATYAAARMQSDTAAALQRRLEQRLASARAMLRAGEVDPLTVAAAEVEYTNGALQHLDAVLRAQEALGALESAVQSPAVIPPRMMQRAESPSSHEP